MAYTLIGEWQTYFNNGSFDGGGISLIAYPNAGYNYAQNNDTATPNIAVGAGVSATDALRTVISPLNGHIGDAGTGVGGNSYYLKIGSFYFTDNPVVAGNKYVFRYNNKITGAAPRTGGQFSVWIEFLGQKFLVNSGYDTAYVLHIGEIIAGVSSNQPQLVNIYIVWDGDLKGQDHFNGAEVFYDNFEIFEYAPDQPALEPFTISGIVTNVTAFGGSDGTITVIGEGGSGTFTVEWQDDLSTDNPRVNLPAGTYDVIATDVNTLEQVSASFVVSEPDPIPEEYEGNTFIEVSPLNSIRMVEEATVNDCEVYETADNTLFCQSGDEYMQAGSYYFQKFNQCDLITMQVKSNYNTHAARLVDYDDDQNVIDTYDVILKKNLTLIETQYSIRIENNTNSQSRVYFVGSLSIPVPIEIGAAFEIVNNADGFNGTYEVIDIKTDSLTGAQYLVINKQYLLGVASTLGDGIFLSTLLKYNIFEFPVDFAGIPIGRYNLILEAIGNDGTTVLRTLLSEPIEVSTRHKNTLYIEYANRDNAFDIDYQTGIINKIRVEARNFKRIPASEQETIRNTDGELRKLLAKPQRKFLIEFFQLPPYLHEKLSVIFNHDIVRINGVQFQTDEAYGEPQYLVRYKLSNSTIVVEQSEWFTTYNNTDVGGVDGQDAGLIIGNEGFILR